MTADLQCTVVSPERPLFEGAAVSVVVPGVDGEIGILPRHAPMIGALGPGVLRLRLAGDRSESFGISGGFVHVKKNVVTLLVNDAMKPQDVDEAKVRSELEATLEALRHPRSTEEFDELLVRRRWAEVRLALLA